MRVGPGRHRWEFGLRDGESASDYESMAALQPLIAPWAKGTIEELELVRVAEYTFRARVAEHWRDRRVFLLGDAAHLTPPFIGQGLGSGLRDAMNLSWKLAGVVTGCLDEAVLDTYEAERKPHVGALIRLAVAMGWAMTAGGRAGSMMRAVAAPRLRLIPGLRSKLIDSATPRLRRSPMVVRSLVHRRLAGALCPNPVLDSGERFDEVVGGRFALVTASTPTTRERAIVKRRGGVIVVAQPRTELWHWLRGGHAIGAIVRPDRTVMRASRNLRTLCAALPTFTA